MRKTFTLSLLFCLFCFATSAQDWEAFTSGKTYHFKSDTAVGLPDQSIHFDSVQALGADSSFSVARRFVFPVDTSQRNQPMFCGKEIRSFSDGNFNFKTPGNFALPTKRGIGSFFTLDSISGLAASVTRVYQGTVLSAAVDSIKVFTTLALDSLVLSKAHGILEWPASMGGARFVLSGIQEDHIGDTLPGFGGFFNLQPGADYFYESNIDSGDLILESSVFRVRFHVDTNQRVMGGMHVAWTGIVRKTHSLGGIIDSISAVATGGSFNFEDHPNST